jgi:hypothetical protein
MLNDEDRIELRRRLMRKAASLGYNRALAGASFDKKVEAVAANSPSKISLSHLANKDDTQILELVHNYKFNCLCAEQQLQDRLLKLTGLNRSRGMHSVSTWWFFIGNPLGFLC